MHEECLDGNHDYEYELTRSKLYKICEPILQKILVPIKDALNAANLMTNDINDVILVGGSTRLPNVKKMLEDYFGRRPKSTINPDWAVAQGATILAGMLEEGKDVTCLEDVTPYSMGIKVHEPLTNQDEMDKIIECNSVLPCSIKK